MGLPECSDHLRAWVDTYALRRLGQQMLIVGRAVAGSGAAAALFSGGMTIVGYSVPLRRRAIYIAALSSMFGIASVVGPILGGALSQTKPPGGGVSGSTYRSVELH